MEITLISSAMMTIMALGFSVSRKSTVNTFEMHKDLTKSDEHSIFFCFEAGPLVLITVMYFVF